MGKVMTNLKELFTKQYQLNLFKGRESKSGPGSDTEQTSTLKVKLINLIQDLNIQSIIDSPCGDFNWMKDVLKELNDIEYLGVDIVDELIQENIKKYGNMFIVGDLVNTILPKSELVICRDCLVHLSFTDTLKILQNFIKSDSKYFLMTTFTNDDRENVNYENCVNWYAINLQKGPFELPMPYRIINENCTECNNEYTDKSLGLWTKQQLESVCGNWAKYLK